MLDPIDFHIDHPDLTERTKNILFVICIVALVIMIIYGIVNSIQNDKIKKQVEKDMEDLRRKHKWGEYGDENFDELKEET